MSAFRAALTIQLILPISDKQKRPPDTVSLPCPVSVILEKCLPSLLNSPYPFSPVHPSTANWAKLADSVKFAYIITVFCRNIKELLMHSCCNITDNIINIGFHASEFIISDTDIVE